MNRALVLIVIVVLLIAGGYLSTTISQQGAAAVPGIRVQTDNPEASVTAVTPTKGGLFAIFTLVALGSVVGMGATVAVIFWLANRVITRAKKDPNADFSFTLAPTTPNSIGSLVTYRPAITVAIGVVLLVILAVTVYVTLNFLGFSIMITAVGTMLLPVIVIGLAVLRSR